MLLAGHSYFYLGGLVDLTIGLVISGVVSIVRDVAIGLFG